MPELRETTGDHIDAVWRTTLGKSLLSVSDGTAKTAVAVSAGTAEIMRAREMLMSVKHEVATQINCVLPALRQEVQELIGAQVAPISAHLSDLASDEYELAGPVPIVIEHYQDEVTARWPEIEAFGAGDTESLAIAALRQDIVDLYCDLKDMPNTSLGRNVQAIRRILMRTVVDAEHE